MVGIYLVCGFIIPFLAMCYLIFNALNRIIRKKLRLKQEYESLDDEEVDPETEIVKPHLDKINELVLSRVNRSAISVWVADAASPQTKPGQAMVS